jgi:hypothetical protein
MDFITDLPKTNRKHDAVLVFCDKLSKMIHLVPTSKKCDAKEAARLLINNVIRLHGIPRRIISDRDVRFTADLYQAIEAALGIKHAFSSAYHPETDGQTERTNRVVEDYLRHYVNTTQTNWEEHIAMAEFAYNNAYHTALQSTPFLLNYGVEPLTPMTLLSEAQLRRRGDLLAKCPNAASFTEAMQTALSLAKKSLQAAQQRDVANANRKRRHVEYKVGDQVLLSTKNLKLKSHGTRKLLPRYIGPFTITKAINATAYKLHLPINLKCHNVFHTSLLKRYNPSANKEMPPLPEVIDGNAEFEVESILGHDLRGTGKHKKTWYRVHWKGYSHDYDMWEPEANLTNCPELLRDYWQNTDPNHDRNEEPSQLAHTAPSTPAKHVRNPT